MNEVKKPRKRLLYYYGIILLVLILFNFFIVPMVTQRRIVEVDYGTFMSMTEKKEIGKVEVQEQENLIVFTDKEEKTIYKTGMMPDDNLTQRLYDAGAKFPEKL